MTCSANYHSGISYERATGVIGDTRFGVLEKGIE